MNPTIISLPVGDNPPKASLYYGQDVIETLKQLPDASVHMVCTSPPYWGLRDYGTGDAQIGLEDSPKDFVAKLVEVFREVARVLRPDGTLWVNLGDSYVGGGGYSPGAPSNQADEVAARGFGGHTEGHIAGKNKVSNAGLPAKSLVGIPWRVALALQDDGWYLRNDIIWAKTVCMPESVRDRFTRSHEYVFLFAHPASKGRYFFDADAVREPYAYQTVGVPQRARMIEQGKFSNEQEFHGKHRNERGGVGERMLKINPMGRNKRTVWNVNPKPFSGAHFAVWPPELVETMIKAGTSEYGVCGACGAPWHREDAGRTASCTCGAEVNRAVVMDIFSGSGTTGMVALSLGRDYLGIDLNPDYLDMAKVRVLGDPVRASQDDPDESSIMDLFGDTP